MYIQFEVPGKPATKGSWVPVKTKAGVSFRPANKNTKDYCAGIAFCAQREMVSRGLKLTSAGVVLMIELEFHRPKSHFNARGQVKDSKPSLHVYKPDADKVARAVLDALTGVVYRDDCQVMELHVLKTWAATHNTKIRVEWDEEPACSRCGDRGVVFDQSGLEEACKCAEGEV